MITLETALADYRSRCDRSTIADYPMMWAAHYGDTKLGEFGIPAPLGDIAQLALTVMAPFSFCDAVTSSVVIVDGDGLPEHVRTLFAVHLAVLKSGHLTLTPWEIEYRMTDTGQVLGEPVTDWFRAPTLYRAVNRVFDRRVNADKFTFDEAYVASINQLNELI